MRPMHAGGVLAGPAFTAKARPGDIIVGDGCGDLTDALIGELMIAHAIQRGLGGMLIAPGNLVIGDDGLPCVPHLEAETIYKAAKAKNDAEEKQMARSRPCGASSRSGK